MMIGLAHASKNAARNRLASESSPYLLLHAGNPVDWYPWGEEAFARAREEGKPIFLSVGYSTCYWCHVMEREVFSDEEIAAQMNDGFVNIKLDREERPDLDEIYMTATQLLTRSGGWPNSLFLNHDLAPFFAGTYFPPHDMRGRPGFPRILQSVREAWLFRRASVEEQARVLGQAIKEQLAPVAAAADPDAATADSLMSALTRRFDVEHGGFGGAPKFPSPANLYFLLDRSHDGDAAAQRMLATTLDHMARGGIQDQLAGGFHRYSTDAAWLVPHFEKMLYDNAALARLYAEAGALEPSGGFDVVATRTLDFILDEMTSADGAFYSAIDAETHGHEGAFYVFNREELQEALGADFDTAARALGFSGEPNFEADSYVLHVPVPLVAGESDDLLVRVRQKLLALRATRERPATDDKVMTDWNGLTIAALARAGTLLDEGAYVAAAERAAQFILDSVRSTAGVLQHTWRGGAARIDALLDDYAFLVDALLELHAATGTVRYHDEALRLQEEQDARLWDEAAGGYFAAGADPRTLVRAKPASDGAGSSGMGISVMNLARLTELSGDGRHLERAREVLRVFSRITAELPIGHVTMVRAARAVAQAAPYARPAGAAADVAAAAPPIGITSGLEATALAIVEARGKLGAAGSDEWRPFTVDLAIRSGWHVNANPPSHPSLIATSVAGEVRNVHYPEAEELSPEFAPSSIDVYGGYVTIEGEVRVAASGDAPTTLRLTYQPCDASRCLAAVTKDVLLR